MSPLRRVTVLVSLVVGVALPSCADKKLEQEAARKAAAEQFRQKLSPEQRAFYDLCRKVKKGMSEQEVDTLLTGYPQQRLNLRSEAGEYTKWYDEKPGANEGDWVLDVTFDDQHRVVDADFTGYIK